MDVVKLTRSPSPRYDVIVTTKRTEQLARSSSVEDDGALLKRTRRAGGPRRNASEPVQFYLPGGDVIDGWALNVSEGGLRAIVEEDVETDILIELTIGESVERRGARVVWVRQEKGGCVLGVSFINK